MSSSEGKDRVEPYEVPLKRYEKAVQDTLSEMRKAEEKPTHVELQGPLKKHAKGIFCFILVNLIVLVLVILGAGGFVLMTSAGYLTAEPDVLREYRRYVERWTNNFEDISDNKFNNFTTVYVNKTDKILGANPLSKLSRDVFDEDYEGVKWVNKGFKVYDNATYPGALDDDEPDYTTKFVITSPVESDHEVEYEYEVPLFRLNYPTVCRSCDNIDYNSPVTTCPNNDQCVDDRSSVCANKLGGTWEATNKCRVVSFLSGMCVLVRALKYDVLESKVSEFYTSTGHIDNGAGCIPDNYSFIYSKGINVFQTNWSTAYYKLLNLSDPKVADAIFDDHKPYPVNFDQFEIRDARDPKLAEIWLTDIGNLDVDHSAFAPSITIPLIVLGAICLAVSIAGVILLLIMLIILNKRWRVRRDREDAKRESAQGLKSQELSEFVPGDAGFSKRAFRKKISKDNVSGFHHYREYYDPLQQIYELRFRHVYLFFWWSLIMTSLAIFFSILSKAMDAIRVSVFKPGDVESENLQIASYVFAGIYVVFMVYYAVEVTVKLLVMRQKFFYLKSHQLPPEDEQSSMAEKYPGIQWGNIFDLFICIVELLINYFGVFLPLMAEEINKVTLTDSSNVNYAKNLNSVLIHVGDGIIIRLLIFMLHYKSLWKIAKGMWRSVVNFVLSFLFLFVLVYLSALAVTALYSAIECVDESFCEQFNTPYKSTFYMFVLLTGDSWSETANKAETEIIGSYVVISIYVCVGAFVLLNIVTGIVIDAILGNDDDQQHREVTGSLDEVLANLTVLHERLDIVEKEINPDAINKPIFEKRNEPSDFISPEIDTPTTSKNKKVDDDLVE